MITDVSAFTNCVKLNFKGKLSSKGKDEGNGKSGVGEVRVTKSKL